MNVLIVDDSIDKISNLTQVISELPFKSFIDNTESISNAILLLRQKVYDIAIVDLHLPLRSGETPNPNGGKELLDEIYRKQSVLNIPKYILGFSQYDNEFVNFSQIWKVVKYEPSKKEWKNAITSLFKHIHVTQKDVNVLKDKSLPTIIVEGITDLNYLDKAFEIFYPNLKDKLVINSQPNAGANWVANQILIWALQNSKDEKNKSIKAIGLLDSDEAGNIAKKKIFDRISTQNEQNTFKIFQILPKYNLEVLKFYQKKCKIELEIESLFPIEIFEYAEKMGWLEYRNITFIENPNDWEQHNQTTSQYIFSKGISKDKLLYAKKVKISKKKEFSKYVLGLKNKEEVFKNFEIMLREIINGLEIKI